MRLLALDIDHTLTGEGHLISKTNLEAVAWAKAQGITVTLITGRRYAASAAKYADQLGISGPVACHYGRRIVDHPSGKILTNHPMPVEVARRLVRLALPHPGAIISAFLDDELVFQKLPPEFAMAAFAQFGEGDLQAMMAARPQSVMSLNISVYPGSGRESESGGVEDAPAEEGGLGPLGHAEDPWGASALGEVAATVHDEYSDLIQLYWVPWGGVERGMVTAISAAADKGTALVEVARLAGVDPADAVAMGDSEADIPMLQAAGIGVAMPWSSEEVRQAADLVADGSPEDAVARAIRALAQAT